MKGWEYSLEAELMLIIMFEALDSILSTILKNKIENKKNKLGNKIQPKAQVFVCFFFKHIHRCYNVKNGPSC